MLQGEKPKRGGIVVGPPHNADGTPGGGVRFPLAGTGRIIEEQGFEINIPHEIRDLLGVNNFKGKNIEVLGQILKLGGYSITDKVEAIEPRDVVICVNSAWADEVSEYIGTIEEILSQINTSKGCKPVLPTPAIFMPSPALLAEGGPVPELNSKGGYDYYGKDKEIAKKCGLVTLPESVEGTNCGNCIFWGTGHCTHSKVVLPVTSRQCCKYWDDHSFGSYLRNIWETDFFADKSKDFPLNEHGGYDYSGEALDRAREADLVTLPPDIPGTNCAENNCMYGKPNKCIHPRIPLPVTGRQSCAWWDNVDVVRPWGAPVETEFVKGGSIPGKGRKKDWQAENADSPRWQKKKEALRELSGTIHRLRTNVSRDIASPDERTALTALAVAIIDKTAERVGNIKSADKGHFGVTGFKRNHVDIVGKKIHFNYKAKKGVPQDKDFSDLRISNALKKAIKNSPKTIDGERNDYLFVTTKGIQTSNKQVNDYVEKFGITAKVMRGYNANRWIIEYLKKQDGSWQLFEDNPEKAKKVRKRIFHKALNETAKRVGHEKATLRKHYMVPELLTEYIDHGRIIDMKSMGYYLNGGSVDGIHNPGPLGDLRVEKYFANKNEVPEIVNKATEKIYVEAQDEGIDKIFNAQQVKEVDWKDVVPTQDFLKSSKFNRLKSLSDLYSIGLPWAVEYQGKYYLNDGHHRAVAMHEAGLPIKLHVYPIESTLMNTGSEVTPQQAAEDPVIKKLLAENSQEILALEFDDSEMLWDEESNRRFYVKRISQDKFVIEESGSLGNKYPEILVIRKELAAQGGSIAPVLVPFVDDAAIVLLGKGGSVPMSKISTLVNSDAGFDILDSDKEIEGSTWSAGGCYVLAKAIQKVYGGELKAIENASGIMDHVLVKIGDKYIDSDGVSTLEEKIRVQAEEELTDSPRMVDFDIKNLGVIPAGSPKTVDKLVNLFTSKMEEGGPAPSVEEKIAKRLQQRQKSKEFKDTGIATYTRKYHAAYEIITLSDLLDIEKDNVTAYKLIEKSKIWPLYNVNELREAGNTSGAAYLKVKCREFLSARPLDTKEAREVYVKNIESLRSGLESVKTALDVKEYLEAFANLDAVYLGDLSSLRTISYISTTYIGNLKNHSSTEVGEYFDNIFGKKFHNFCLVKSDTARTIFAEAFLYEGYTQAQRDFHVSERYRSIQDTIKKYSALRDKIQASNGSNETVKQLIKESGITYYEYNYDKKYVLDWIDKYLTFFNTQTKEKINSSLSKSYTVREEDWSWFGAEKKAAEPKGEEEKVRKPQNIFEKYGIEVPKVLKRTPLDYIKRTGGLAVGDVSTKAVLENYGFKNIIYGNYVNDAESKEHTKHILGAMLDMVELCNIDIKDINKLGGLDINIGSTGCGSFSRASACYFPQLKAINLTKKRGDGSLGHEWSHYLDNILSEGTSKKATNIQYATLNPAQSERVTTLFSEYKNWLMNGGTPRKITVTYYPQKKYQFRVYGETLPLAIEGVQRRHASKDYKNFDTNDLARYYGFLAYKLNDNKPLEVELETKATKFWVATSRFSPSDYFLSPKEMFARAFEGWLEYKMQKMGRVNNYLVDIKSGMGLYALVIPRSEWCYPFGEDVIWLDDWFERLFSAIRVDYGISPFTWGTKDRVDEYTDYKDTKNEKVDAGVEVNTDGTVIVEGDIEEFEKGYGFRIETLKDGKGENRNIYRLLTDPYSRGKGFAVGGKQSDVFIFALKYFTDVKSGYGIADGLSGAFPNIAGTFPDAKLEEAKREAIEYFKNNKESKPKKPMTQESDYQPELFAEGGGIEGLPEKYTWQDIKEFFEGQLPSKLPSAKDRISFQTLERAFERAPFDYLNVRPIPYKLKSIDEPLKNVVGTDELRPAMMGVYYDPEQNQKVATNAHILVVIKDKSIKSKKLVDPNTGKEISKIKDPFTNKESEVRYPNYMAVIPMNNAYKMHLTESQVDQLMDELNGIVRAKRFLQEREEQKIIAKITHQDLEIYVNPVFLLTVLAALKQYGATAIDLEFSSPNRAIMVIDSRKNGNRGLVMPVMYKDDFIPVKILDDAKVSAQLAPRRPAAPVPAAAAPAPAKPVHKPAPKKDRKKPNTIHSCAVRMGRKGGLASAKVKRMDDGGGVEDMTMEQLYEHVQEVMPAVKLASSDNEIKIFTEDETLFTGDGPDKEKFSVIYLAGLLAGYDQHPEMQFNGGGIEDGKPALKRGDIVKDLAHAGTRNFSTLEAVIDVSGNHVLTVNLDKYMQASNLRNPITIDNPKHNPNVPTHLTTSERLMKVGDTANNLSLVRAVSQRTFGDAYWNKAEELVRQLKGENPKKNYILSPVNYTDLDGNETEKTVRIDEYTGRLDEGGPVDEPVVTEDAQEPAAAEPASQESPKTCMCFSTFLRTEKPELVEKMMDTDVNSDPALRAEVDQAYQAWQGGSMNDGGAITVNGYKIKYNDFWKKFQVSHPEIGANVAEFDTQEEAIDHAKNG